MCEKVDIEAIRKTSEEHSKDRGGLIGTLEAIQSEYGYLPEEALRTVASSTGRSLVDLYGMATFYRAFSLQPRGEHVISACLGTACHVRGAQRVVEEFRRQLAIEPGETTEDRQFTLETVNCLGACALGPVVVIDGRYFPRVRRSRVKQLIDSALEGFDRAQAGEDKRIFPIDVSCPRCNHSLMDKNFAIDGAPSIRLTMSFGDERGWLRLSSLYGNHSSFSECNIPANAVASFFCPYCHRKLAGLWDCPTCGAPMAPMIVRGGGMLQICSRHGCEGHMLDVV